MKTFLSFCLFLCSAFLLAAEAPPQFRCGSNASFADGVYTLTSDGKAYTTCHHLVQFPAPESRTIVFSAETRTISDSGKADAGYSLMLNDGRYEDGSKKGYVAARPCPQGPEWQKVELRYTPAKPMTAVRFRLVFARRVGKVEFRDPQITYVTPEKNAKPAAKPAPAPVNTRAIAKAKLSEYGKRTTFVRNLYLETPLVRNGRPAAAIVGSAELAGRINRAVQAKTGCALPVVPDTQYTGDKLDTHLIVVGSRDRNRTASSLYSRYYTMVDARYPGKAGYEVRTIHNVFGDGHNVITVAGSVSDEAAVDCLVRKIEAAPKGKDLILPRLTELKLDPSLKLPDKIEDLTSWNALKPDSRGAMGYGWNSFGRAFYMLYVTGERKYADMVMRFAFPDKETIRELDRRDTETYKEMRERPLVGIYHYLGISAILWWDLVEESPVWTPEEREKLTREFYLQLIHHLTASEFSPYRFHAPLKFDGKDRHNMWEMALDYACARYFAKYYPGPESAEMFRLCRNMDSTLYEHYMHPGITVSYHSTALNPILHYTLLRYGDEKIGNPMLVKLIRSLGILAETHPEKGDWYTDMASPLMLEICAYLAQDKFYHRLAEQKGFGPEFRAGQSFIPVRENYPHDFARDSLNKWSIAPTQENGPIGDIEYLSWRDDQDNMLLLDTRYSPGRIAFHHLSLSSARVNGVLLLRGLDNAMQFYPEGLSDMALPRAAKVLHTGPRTVTAKVANVHGFDWQRTWKIEGDVLTAEDTVTPLRDMKFAEILNSFCPAAGSEWQRLADGSFRLRVPHRGKMLDYHLQCSPAADTSLESTRALLGSGSTSACFNLVLKDLKAGTPVKITSTLKPGQGTAKPLGSDRTAPRAVWRIPGKSPVGILHLLPNGEIAAAAGKSIRLLNAQGKVLVTIPTDGIVTSFAHHKDTLFAAIYVKPGEEYMLAYDMRGKLRWKLRSEMPEELVKRGAPYWQKPAVRGIRAMLVAEVTPGKPMLYAGSASSVEIVTLDGKCTARVRVTSGPMDHLVFRPATKKAPKVPARVLILHTTGGWPTTFEIDDRGNVSRPLMNRDLDGKEMLLGYNAVGHRRIFSATRNCEPVLVGDFNGTHNRLCIWSYDGKTMLKGINIGAWSFMPWSGPIGLPAETHYFVRELLPLGDDIGLAVCRKRFYRFDKDLRIKQFLVLNATPLCMTADGETAYLGMEDGHVRAITPDGSMTILGAVDGKVYSLQTVPNGIIVGSSEGEIACFAR